VTVRIELPAQRETSGRPPGRGRMFEDSQAGS